MPSAGPNYPAAGADNAGTGSSAWSNPGNVTAEDGTCATATMMSLQASHFLVATGFGFAVPLGATIVGILVEWKRKASVSGTSINDNAVRIVQGGAVGSTDGSVGTQWPLALSWITYGAPTNLWGLTWTPADVNAANFGAAISAIPQTSDTANVDACRITVYYTPAVPGPVPPRVVSMTRIHPAQLE